ncbi:hypothetical protein SAMN05216388_1001154 [Halorientalis persicus]|uniref:Uncharacterized protein n=1 Tax=Halorientalis persicus TaxID=1367881 RepID=A0A1H8D2G9_9EURY|nr:hypothetical protein SAMN05216388_1001154 [Halorientalis persicus]
MPDGGDDTTGMGTAGAAEYVLGCRFRLDPTPAELRAEPAEFETKLYREADPPGEEGWLFFRDNCWRGELNDPEYIRDLTEDRWASPCCRSTSANSGPTRPI